MILHIYANMSVQVDGWMDDWTDRQTTIGSHNLIKLNTTKTPPYIPSKLARNKVVGSIYHSGEQTLLQISTTTSLKQ